jgi:tetratricopeptide (TPR) repeat protein
MKEAIEIFKLNVAAYPKAWNSYDSLGEAYMINGNKELAIKNYKKSLELNPKNNSALKMLKKLTQE